ncbi:MAG: hypothetical protein IJ685_12605 [Selenomonadaceae bacterium]|nr:hypothetical protein [Selenomonadaceae bacterium]
MKNFIEILLRDQTTGKNILWANVEFGNKEIQPAQIDSIEPRWKKNREQQKLRTKTRAEIFTPPEVCKLQNKLICDESDWIKFIDAKFLEITCGEAPYLVSRYNVVTGESIPIPERVGLLDRKLRLVNSETKTLTDWQEFAIRAVQSIYGYDFQGDNLFLARRNVFETVKDYFTQKNFSCRLPEDFLIAVATIISWNLWQMDGLKFTVPYAQKLCRIMDWRTNEPFMFMELFGM